MDEVDFLLNKSYSDLGVDFSNLEDPVKEFIKLKDYIFEKLDEAVLSKSEEKILKKVLDKIEELDYLENSIENDDAFIEFIKDYLTVLQDAIEIIILTTNEPVVAAAPLPLPPAEIYNNNTASVEGVANNNRLHADFRRNSPGSISWSDDLTTEHPIPVRKNKNTYLGGAGRNHRLRKSRKQRGKRNGSKKTTKRGGRS